MTTIKGKQIAEKNRKQSHFYLFTTQICDFCYYNILFSNIFYYYILDTEYIALRMFTCEYFSAGQKRRKEEWIWLPVQIIAEVSSLHNVWKSEIHFCFKVCFFGFFSLLKFLPNKKRDIRHFSVEFGINFNDIIKSASNSSYCIVKKWTATTTTTTDMIISKINLHLLKIHTMSNLHQKSSTRPSRNSFV